MSRRVAEAGTSGLRSAALCGHSGSEGRKERGGKQHGRSKQQHSRRDLRRKLSIFAAPTLTYIQRLADIVDAKMRAVAQHTSTVDSLRVAVLAALNIADEYYQLKRKYEGIESEYTSRTTHLGQALDSALDEVTRRTRRTGLNRCWAAAQFFSGSTATLPFRAGFVKSESPGNRSGTLQVRAGIVRMSFYVTHSILQALIRLAFLERRLSHCCFSRPGLWLRLVGFVISRLRERRTGHRGPSDILSLPVAMALMAIRSYGYPWRRVLGIPAPMDHPGAYGYPGTGTLGAYGGCPLGEVHIKTPVSEAQIYINGSFAGQAHNVKHIYLKLPAPTMIEQRIGNDVQKQRIYVTCLSNINVEFGKAGTPSRRPCSRLRRRPVRLPNPVPVLSLATNQTSAAARARVTDGAPAARGSQLFSNAGDCGRRVTALVEPAYLCPGYSSSDPGAASQAWPKIVNFCFCAVFRKEGDSRRLLLPQRRVAFRIRHIRLGRRSQLFLSAPVFSLPAASPPR